MLPSYGRPVNSTSAPSLARLALVGLDVVAAPLLQGEQGGEGQAGGCAHRVPLGFIVAWCAGPRGSASLGPERPEGQAFYPGGAGKLSRKRRASLIMRDG